MSSIAQSAVSWFENENGAALADCERSVPLPLSLWPASCLPVAEVLGHFIPPESWDVATFLSLKSKMVETSCNSHQCHLICSQLHIGPLHTFHRQCRGNLPGIGTLHCPRCRPGIPRSQSTTGLAFLGTSRTCVRSSRGSRRTSEESTRTSWGEHRQGTALWWKLLYSFNYMTDIISDNALKGQMCTGRMEWTL